MGPKNVRSLGRHRWVLVTVLVLFVIIVTAVVVLINPSAIASRVKESLLPQVSQRLGRDVDVGGVHVTLFPHVTARLADVSVAGAPGEPPLLRGSEVGVALKLWPLIRSRGHDIEISSVELRDLDINLVRRRDGSWSFEDLLKGGAATRQPSAPKSPAKVVISEVRLTNGSVRVIDEEGRKRGLKEASTIALTQVNLTAHDVAPGRATSLELSAAVASNQPNVTGRLSVDPLPGSAADLRSGRWPKVSGQIDLVSLAVQRLADFLPAKSGDYFSGGSLSVVIRLTTPAPAEYAASGEAHIDQLDLRGSRASGSFNLAATMNPNHPGELTADVTSLKLQGPGVDLTGNASYQGAHDRLRFELTGKHLALDSLLAALPPSRSAAASGQPLLPPPMRREVTMADVAGTLSIGQLTSGKLEASQLQAEVRLINGELELTKGRITLYDGSARVDGSKVNLAARKPTWELHATIRGVNVGRALQALESREPLTGLADGDVNLHGAGNDWNELRTTLQGKAVIALANGELTTVNLTKQIAEPLSQALEVVGRGRALPKEATSGRTELKDLTARVSIENGWMSLEQPLTVNVPFGTMSLTGRVSLAEQLDLKGTAALSPQFLATIAGGALPIKGSVDVPIRIGGTVQSPAIEAVDWGVVAREILKQQTQGAQKQLEQQAREKLKEVLPLPGF